MSIGTFDYFGPDTLEEAIDLLQKNGPDARIMAGGTDLLVKTRLGAVSPKALISLKNIPGLDAISVDPRTGLTIGAMARLADVAAHPEIQKQFPAIAAAANDTANVQVRNMGTVVGNLCNASPSADNAPPLLVMDAALHITGSKGERSLALGDFFKGPGVTALEPDEIVTAVSVPPAPPSTGVVYLSFSGRGKLDCSTVGIGALITLEKDICRTSRIAIGACAPTPMRAFKTETALTGSTVNEALLRSASVKAAEETSPIDDLRASAAYRLKVVEVLAYRVLVEACRIAGG
jgi:carbon-monoxide dehydrogenase medium subunit